MTLDLSACDDGELVAFAVAGRQQAYRELMRRHKDPMFRVISKTIGDADLAVDLVQETFVSAFGAIHRYDRSRPFKVWLARIALNKCRDWARRRAVRSFFSFARPLDAAEDHESDAPDAHKAAEGKAELARVQAAMAKLPHNLREVLVLRGIEELSQNETANALGISEKAVETRLYRARAQLKEMMGGTSDEDTD